MKTISVSTLVYGAIWGKAIEGDDSEEDILRRVFGLPQAQKTNFTDVLRIFYKGDEKALKKSGGFTDVRSGVHFPEGFSIHRRYKGQHYTARVHEGVWRMPNREEAFSSLNSLNRAIGANSENAWISWFYGDGDEKAAIDKLRAPDSVHRRK